MINSMPHTEAAGYTGEERRTVADFVFDVLLDVEGNADIGHHTLLDLMLSIEDLGDYCAVLLAFSMHLTPEHDDGQPVTADMLESAYRNLGFDLYLDRMSYDQEQLIAKWERIVKICQDPEFDGPGQELVIARAMANVRKAKSGVVL